MFHIVPLRSPLTLLFLFSFLLLSHLIRPVSTSCNGTLAQTPVHFYPGDMLHHVGHRSLSNSSVWVVDSSDPSGYMTYGPYVALFRDDLVYRVDFVLSIDINEGEEVVLLLDSYENEAKTIFVSREIRKNDFLNVSSPQTFSLAVRDTVCSSILEFRVFFYGGNGVEIHHYDTMVQMLDLPKCSSENPGGLFCSTLDSLDYSFECGMISSIPVVKTSTLCSTSCDTSTGTCFSDDEPMSTTIIIALVVSITSALIIVLCMFCCCIFIALKIRQRRLQAMMELEMMAHWDDGHWDGNANWDDEAVPRDEDRLSQIEKEKDWDSQWIESTGTAVASNSTSSDSWDTDDDDDTSDSEDYDDGWGVPVAAVEDGGKERKKRKRRRRRKKRERKEKK